MKALLDTHTLLWWMRGDSELSTPAKAIIEEGEENEIYFSLVSAWEISIKAGLGKLRLNKTLKSHLYLEMKENNLQALPIQLSHVVEVQHLDFHHRDPFDRLLAATCLIEKLPIVSRDTIFDKYGVDRIW